MSTVAVDFFWGGVEGVSAIVPERLQGYPVVTVEDPPVAGYCLLFDLPKVEWQC